MKKNNVLKGLKPLFFDNEAIILSKGNTIFFSTPSEKIKILFSFPSKFDDILCNFNKLVYRFQRSGVGSSIIFRDEYFFSYNRKLYSFSINEKCLNEEKKFENGRGPLQFCIIDGIRGFNDGLLYGEYFGNHARNPVKIFKRNKEKIWESIFTFKKNEINHIHALIPDKIRNCIWILAGDFEYSASIWMATDNFNKIVPILKGNQKYRACVAFPVNEGLLYATDTQISSNSIRLLKCNNKDRWISKKLFDINGSCIYGCELKDYYVFSTATEPTDKKKGFLALIDNKPASKILKNQSEVISLSKENFSKNIISYKKKDIWPYRLFQFGAIMFPTNSSKSNKLYAYNVGSIKNDLSTEIFNLKK